MGATLFESSELVTRSNVNSRITAINTDITNLTPVSLYDNSSGTQSTVPLSSSAIFYTYMDIYYRNDDNRYGYNRIYSPNGKSAALFTVNYWDSRMFLRAANVNISGVSITWDNGIGWETIASNNVYVYPDTNLIWITKVVGYK